MLQKMRTLVRNLFRRDGAERELEAEVRSFAAMLEEEQMSNGISSNEARRPARMSMDGPEQLKEEIRSARRGAWTLS